MRKSFVAALVVCLVPALALAGAPGTSLTNPGNGPVVTATTPVDRPVIMNAGTFNAYDSEAAYEAATADLGQKRVDFENSTNGCPIAGFDGPLKGGTPAGGFPGTGAIEGLIIDTQDFPTFNLVSIPPGFGGNGTCTVAGNYFTDRPTYRTGDFGKSNVRAIGGEMQSFFAAGSCELTTYDTNGTTVIDVRTVSCTNAGAFFGLERTNGDIGGINIYSLSNQAEGMDDIHHSPEPTTMVLLGAGALALIRRRR